MGSSKNPPLNVRIFFLNLREIEGERRDQIKTLKGDGKMGKVRMGKKPFFIFRTGDFLFPHIF